MEDESDIDDEFLEDLLTADNGMDVKEDVISPSAQNDQSPSVDDFSSELRELERRDLSKGSTTKKQKRNVEPLNEIGNRSSQLNRSSLLHRGDTDSSDDEDSRNCREAKLSDYGRSIKTLLPDSGSSEGYRSERSSTWAGNRGTNKSTFAAPSVKSSKELVDTDPIFGMRIVNPLVSGSGLQERMVGRTPIAMATVKQFTMSSKDKDTDWVIAGAVVFKSPIRTSQKGSQYCIWKLSDLKGLLKTVTVFLFSSAYKNLWKTSVGTIVAILNPSVIDNRDGSDEAALSVDTAQKVMVLGGSKDYGICKARKKNGDPCSAFVNKSNVDVCIYHMTREYQKCSRRSELQAPMPRVNLRNKVLGKNEVFYGGRSFVSQPRVQNRKHAERDAARLSCLAGGATQQAAQHTRAAQRPAVRNRKTAARLEAVDRQRKRDAERLAILAGGASKASGLVPRSSTPQTRTSEAADDPRGNVGPALDSQASPRIAIAPAVRKLTGKLSFRHLEAVAGGSNTTTEPAATTEALATGEVPPAKNADKETRLFLINDSEETIGDERLAEIIAKRKARNESATVKRRKGDRESAGNEFCSPTTSPDRKGPGDGRAETKEDRGSSGLNGDDAERHATGSAEQQATASVEQQATASAEQQATASVEQQATASTKQQATASAEQQATASAEQSATASVEQQATASAEQSVTSNATELQETEASRRSVEAMVAEAVGEIGEFDFVEDWLAVEADFGVRDSATDLETNLRESAKNEGRSAASRTDERPSMSKERRIESKESREGSKSKEKRRGTEEKRGGKKESSGGSKQTRRDSKESTGVSKESREGSTSRSKETGSESSTSRTKGNETEKTSSCDFTTAAENRLLRKHRERMKAKKELEALVVPEGIRLHPRLNPEEMKPKEDIVLPSAKSFLMSIKNGGTRVETDSSPVARGLSNNRIPSQSDSTRKSLTTSTRTSDRVPSQSDSTRRPAATSTRPSDRVPSQSDSMPRPGPSEFVPRLDAAGFSTPRLGLGNFNGFIDLSTPIPKNRIEQAKMKAVQWARQNGGLAKTNPSIKAAGNSSAAAAVKRKIEDLETDVGAAEKARRLEAAVKEARFIALMDVKSRHAEDLLVAHDDQEKETYFNKLERKEKMEEQMSQTFSVKCKAVTCVECKYTAFSAAEICRSDGHRLRVTEGTKRFYRCADCGYRTVTLQRLPSTTCAKCRSSRWERAPMMKERKAETTSIPLSIRGGEEKFIGSLQSDGNIGLLVPIT